MEGWTRLSPLKLAVDPIKALKEMAVPVVLGTFGASQSGFISWQLALVALVGGSLVFGALPWLTTYYRITETQFQLRSGVLNKKSSTAPLDRVRSVDLEASLLHRLLNLVKVQIGTGVDDERITLDGITREEASALRTRLLTSPAAPAPAEVEGEEAAYSPAAAEPTALAELDWSWLRFAPFSLAKLVVVAGAVGVLSQLGDQLPIWDVEHAESAWEWLRQWALVAVVALVVLGALAAWLVISVGGYAIQWWNFRLTRESGNLHLTSGLFTTRSVTVEEARVRGVELSEPVLLRAVGGAELSTLATGLESGVTKVLPPCPEPVARRVGSDVLTDAAPLHTQLRSHGFRARRRAWFQALDNALSLPLAAALVLWKWPVIAWAWWWAGTAAMVLLAAVGAELAYRHLGHALTERHLVAGSGVWTRVRTVLETDGIIGWNIDQSIFQRRLRLATLTATTAAGSEKVVVRDIDLALAVALADAATPGMLTPFLDQSSPTGQAP